MLCRACGRRRKSRQKGRGKVEDVRGSASHIGLMGNSIHDMVLTDGQNMELHIIVGFWLWCFE